MFDWDPNNLRKIRAHQIKRETRVGRLLAVVVTEGGNSIRVVTAYDLDAGQKRDYLQRRMRGEWVQ